jgi:hypothetical protein
MPAPRLLYATLLLGSFTAPGAAAAQQGGREQPSRLNVALGLSMNSPADVNQAPKCVQLSLPCNTPRTFPDFGIAINATYRVAKHFAFAAEASFYGNSWDTTGVSHSKTNHVTAVLAGPQITTGLKKFVWWNDTTRLNAFAQVLVGAEASTVLPTRTAIQPGVGIDFKLPPELIWLRVAYDYRSTQGAPRNLSQSRISVGLAITARGK